MSWLDENLDGRSYHLRDKESLGDTHGDSLHHTMMIFCIIELSRKTKSFDTNLMAKAFLNKEYCDRAFVKEAVKFIPNGTPIRSWVIKNNMLSTNDLKANWWVSKECVSRDQIMAFVIASHIFGWFKKENRAIFWRVVRACGFFPNTRKNRTLERKSIFKLEFPDVLNLDALAQFYKSTGIWWLWPFKFINNFFLPLEALFNAHASENTDHVKFIIKLIADDSIFAKWASYIFINYRVNDEVTESYNLGHPVLNVWRRYWREDAGHAKEIYFISVGVLEEWISRHAR